MTTETTRDDEGVAGLKSIGVAALVYDRKRGFEDKAALIKWIVTNSFRARCAFPYTGIQVSCRVGEKDMPLLLGRSINDSIGANVT